MPNFPDDELGWLEYNKEKRRGALAIKSRAALQPQNGTAAEHKSIYENHENRLRKAPPVPNDGAGGYYVNVVHNVMGNNYQATNSERVGIFDSVNEPLKPKNSKPFWRQN